MPALTVLRSVTNRRRAVVLPLEVDAQLALRQQVGHFPSAGRREDRGGDGRSAHGLRRSLGGGHRRGAPPPGDEAQLRGVRLLEESRGVATGHEQVGAAVLRRWRVQRPRVSLLVRLGERHQAVGEWARTAPAYPDPNTF